MRIIFSHKKMCLIVIIFMIIPLHVIDANDLFNFDLTWSDKIKIQNSKYTKLNRRRNDRVLNYLNDNYYDINRLNDNLESDYGVFVDERSKFQTQNQTRAIIQKSPNNTTNQDQIGSLLKNYFKKLYTEKYANGQNKSNHYKFDDQESKFFDNSLWNYHNGSTKFSNKFLSLFTVVQFPNSQCQASGASGNYQGTCYHATECSAMNGTAMGNCANGYGVCCVFRYSCGNSSSQNCTYFESPGYPNYYPSDSGVLPPTPSTSTSSPTPDPRLPPSSVYYHQTRWTRQISASSSLFCSINIWKLSDDVQQIRIDFVDLELLGPTNGSCVLEQFVVSGQNLNDQIPVICGYNTGQHMYVDVSTLSGPLTVSVLSNVVASKRYKVKICQIVSNCTDSNNNNCLQYYTGVSGVISSFNYDQAVAFNRSVGGYFNNLNYAICIRKEAGYCSITYMNTRSGLEYPFQLRNVDNNGVNVLPPGQAGADIFNCPDDYLVIGGTRLCGDKFNDGSVNSDFRMNWPVTDNSAGPIVILVRTDSTVTGRGFKLFYTQNQCN